MGQFTQDLKNRCDTYEHVQLSNVLHQEDQWRSSFSCSIVFFNVLPRHTNFFEECVARCAHLSTQEKECTSFSWEDSKMYIPGSIANSQRMLTEINESDAIAKIK